MAEPEQDEEIWTSLTISSELKISLEAYEKAIETFDEHLPEYCFLDDIHPDSFVDGYASVKSLDWHGEGALDTIWDIFAEHIVPMLEGIGSVIYTVDPIEHLYIGLRIANGVAREAYVSLGLMCDVEETGEPMINSYTVGYA